MNDSSIQVPPALYIAQRLPSGSCHIIDHLIVEVLKLLLKAWDAPEGECMMCNALKYTCTFLCIL